MRKFFGLLILIGLLFALPGEMFIVKGTSIDDAKKEVKSYKHTVETCFVYIETAKETECKVVNIVN